MKERRHFPWNSRLRFNLAGVDMQATIRNLLVLTLGLLSCTTAYATGGHGGEHPGGLKVVGKRIVGVERIQRGFVDVTYRIKVKNTGEPQSNVVVTVLSTTPKIEVLDAEVVLGEVGKGRMTSSDTFTIRKKKRKRVRGRDLKFIFSTDENTNLPPEANAGMDRTVDAGTLVTLDGSASSDPDGDVLSYTWVLTPPEGSNATLDDPTRVNPSFTADLPGNYLVSLIVNDGTVDSETDTATICATEVSLNTPPVANAGPDQAVDTGSTVSLNGSDSSDVDQDPLSYSWALQRPASSTATLSDAGSVNPTFVADTEGTYTATLIVNDGTEDSAPDSMTVVATDVFVNTPPVAVVGSDQDVQLGATVTLDGSASNDADQDPLTYTWSLQRPPGSSAALSDASSVSPTFVADVAGDYLATLIVNDGLVDSAPAETTVSASFAGENPPSILSTPETSGSINVTYFYDVEATDPDAGDVLTYSLSQAPPGMSINPSTGLIDWLPGNAGPADVDVLVTDSTGRSDRQLYLILVNNGSDDQPPTLAPIADQSTVVQETIMLTAVGTDPEGEPVSYGLSTLPPGMVIHTDTGELLWSPDIGQVGNFSATVTVTDPGGQSASQSFNVSVTAEPANNTPQIQAVPDRVVSPLESVQITLAATDPDPGDVLTFSLNGAPNGMQFDIGAGAINWLPDPSTAGTYNLTASVTDSAGASASTEFAIVVTEPAGPPVAVDDAYTIDRNFQLQIQADGVLTNDTDPNNDLLVASNTSLPGLGTLDSFPGDGGFNYTPPANPNITIGFREQCRSQTPTVARFGAPLVGDIDADGEPEIIGVSNLGTSLFNYRIWVMEGATCALESDITVNYLDVGVPDVSTMPTLVNLDGDPQLELLFVRRGPPELGVDLAGLVALNQDGSLVWDITPDGSSEAISLTTTNPGFSYYAGQGPTVTDLDGDGAPEIIMALHFGNAGASQFFSGVVAYNTDGSIRWEYQGVPQGGDADSKGVYIADLDLDGTVEVLHHTNVLDHNGQLEFTLPAELDIFGVASSHLTLAIANLDNDPFPEILGRDMGNNYVFEHTGALKWSVPTPNNARAEITVAELDGDPLPEFVYHTGQGTGSNASWLTAYDTDGSELWSHQGTVYDGPATALDNYHGATAFDFDQDGIDEITIALPANNGAGVYMFRGNDGSLVDAFIDGGGTDGVVFVTIADVDNDGAAEVIYSDRAGSGNDPYVVLEGLAGNPFPPARPVRHQYLYQPTHVNTDGTLPPYPQPHWLIPGLNKFNAAPVVPFEDPGATDSFNYVASDATTTSNEATVTIAITNVNAPTIISQPQLGASPDFSYQYGLLATDGDFGDSFTWTLVDAPAGMTLSPFGIIDWLPQSSDLGPNRVHVVVTDAQGNSDEQAFTIDVVPAVVVPDILGADEAAARASLESAGLAVGSVTQGFSLTVPIGEVISQSVSGGDDSAAGEFIDFVISLGPQPIFVPSLLGITPSVAGATLSSLSLNLGVVTFVNDSSVPRGLILSQSLAANTEVAINTQIDVTVSGGPSLALSLARNFLGPDESVAFGLTFFDNAGNPVAQPADMVLSVIPDADATGATPAITGTTISTSADTRGAFAVRVQSGSLGVDVSEEILVSSTLANDGVQAPYMVMSAQINRLVELFDALAQAVVDNDLPAIQILGANLATEHAAIDLEALRTTPAAAPETGFLPLSAPGAPSSNDAAFPQILAGLISQVDETGAFLGTLDPNIARDDDLRNRFLSNALQASVDQFDPELLTRRGSVAFASGLHELLSVSTPELVLAEVDAALSALFDAGLLADNHTSAEFYQQIAHATATDSTIRPTFFTLGGLMSGSAVRMRIIKNYYFPIVKKIVFHMQNLVLEDLIRQLITVESIPGIVTGASLSFHSFALGNSIIEADTAAEFPDGNIVLLIGPTLLADVQAALNGLNVSFGSLREVREAYENVRDTAQAARDAVAQNYQQLTPDQSVNGCVFSTVPGCRQLGISNGIPTVSTEGAFPAPVLILAYNATTGELSIGNFLFYSRPQETTP